MTPGDYVRREDLEGQVVSLSWRSVHLRTERNSTPGFPNSEFTSRMMEINRRDQSFRHQLSFNVAADHRPGQVIRVAMRVLRSDLPAVCASPAPSAIMQGNYPPRRAACAMLRGCTRCATWTDPASAQPSSSGYGTLQRRSFPVAATHRTGVDFRLCSGRWRAADAGSTSGAGALQTLARADSDARAGERGASVLQALVPRIGARLLATTSLLRYAAEARCDPLKAGILADGRLREERATDPASSHRIWATGSVAWLPAASTLPWAIFGIDCGRPEQHS